MTRTRLACYGLLASAFILAALVLVQASRFLDTSARADQVVNKDSVTMITARSHNADSEILYVLEAENRMLMAYMLDPNREVLQLLSNGTLDVGRAFEQYLSGGASRDNQPNNRRRR
jgi:hypothetical protein